MKSGRIGFGIGLTAGGNTVIEYDYGGVAVLSYYPDPDYADPDLDMDNLAQ